MTLMPEIRDALARAVVEQGARTPKQVRKKAISGRRYVVIAMLLAATSAAAAVVGGVQPWADHGPPSSARTATAGTVNLSIKEARSLSVLSRPQQDGATPPEMKALADSLAPLRMGKVDSGRIRVLRRKGRDLYLLVPLRGSRLPGGRRAAPGSHVLCTVHGIYNNKAARGTPTFAGGAGCGTRERDLGAGRFLLRDGLSGPDRIAGIVPDKVARVSAKLTDGRTVYARVNGNFFLVNAGAGSSPTPPTITWFDKLGRRVKPRS